MDSSDHPQTTNSTESMSSDTADNSSMMALSKRDIFLSTYNRRQKFTFPDSIMHYIAKNPKNATVYQKMIKRCKYFFIKNPILVFSWLRYGQNGWETTVKDDWKSIDMNKLSSKLWITDGLMVYPEDVSNVASSIIPKIYRCDVKRLDLENQVISLNELIFLCSSVKELDLLRITVKNDDDTVVLFEEFVKQLPQLNRIK
uniref:Uncharacterized protein n=1 Tax=Panagrolaimus superbus TaxID=310955 RepID=A0A914YYE0_9BILA